VQQILHLIEPAQGNDAYKFRVQTSAFKSKERLSLFA
jgi:hypothetical protein